MQQLFFGYVVSKSGGVYRGILCRVRVQDFGFRVWSLG